MDSLYKRIAKVESHMEAQKEDTLETLTKCYRIACEQKNEEDASVLARKIRNKMLKDSDCQMVLDRFEMPIPTGNTFTSWLTFLRDFSKILSSDWAKYRQELRDLPKQKGFPFDITFPNPPKSKVGEEK